MPFFALIIKLKYFIAFILNLHLLIFNCKLAFKGRVKTFFYILLIFYIITIYIN
jgi:hypothetical protein